VRFYGAFTGFDKTFMRFLLFFFFNWMSSWEFVGFNGISPATNGDLMGFEQIASRKG
jgi:hypothetical protein